MASFQKYNTKQGHKWLFITDGGIDPQTGKRKQIKRRGFNTKKEAQTAATQVEQELLNGTFITQELTYQEAYEQWLANHEKTIKTSTRKSIDSKFKRHILPHFGKLKLKDISRAYCQKVWSVNTKLDKTYKDCCLNSIGVK